MKKLFCLVLMFIFISCRDKGLYPITMFEGNNVLEGKLAFTNILDNNSKSELDSAICNVTYKFKENSEPQKYKFTLKKEFELTTIAKGNYTFDFESTQMLGKEIIYYKGSTPLIFNDKKNVNHTLEPILSIDKIKSGKAILKVNVKDEKGNQMPKTRTCIYTNEDFRDQFYSCQGSIDSTETNAKGVAYFTGLEANQTYFLKSVKIANTKIPIMDTFGKIIGYEIKYLNGGESTTIVAFSTSNPINKKDLIIR